MKEQLYGAMADYEERHWWFVGKNSNVRRLIERLGPRASPDLDRDRRPRALDVGCGTGGLLAYLAERYNAIGVDMAAEARACCAERGLEAIDGSLPHNMPFDGQSFDLIIASEVLEHVEDDAGAARTLVRFLRPEGLLVVTVPAFQWLWSVHDTAHHHFRRYTRTRLLGLFADQPVRPEIASYYNTSFFPLMIAARVASKALGSRREASVDLRPPPEPVNSMMASVFKAEGHALDRATLPFGGSVIAAFRKA